MLNLDWSWWEWVWVMAGGVSILIQCWFYLWEFGSLAFFMIPERKKLQDPVSVVICARNELKNLRANLELILQQDYPAFQVVVVNDCSWDESGKYLEEMEKIHPHLKVVTIEEQEKYRHGKKFALSLGIKAAAYDLLLMTDADCAPVSPQWISNMMSGYGPSTEMVIGYGAYRKGPGLLNRWIRLDTVFNAIQYLSAALWLHAYMGVGRNLSYRRSLFFKNKGFARHGHLLSGDDDLFVNETARRNNAAVVMNRESFTYSVPATSLSSWLRQKKRHLSTGFHYKLADRVRIGAFFLTQFVFYLSLAALAFTGFHWQWLAGAFALRMLLQLFIFGRCMQRLGELDLLWLVPVFDVLVILIYPIISLSNLLFKDKSWR